MLRSRTILVALGLCMTVTACETPQQKVASKEDMLTAAGFKFRPINTPQRQAALQQLPPHKFSRKVNDGWRSSPAHLRNFSGTHYCGRWRTRSGHRHRSTRTRWGLDRRRRPTRCRWTTGIGVLGRPAIWLVLLEPGVEALQDYFQRRRSQQNRHRASLPPFCASAIPPDVGRHQSGKWNGRLERPPISARLQTRLRPRSPCRSQPTCASAAVARLSRRTGHTTCERQSSRSRSPYRKCGRPIGAVLGRQRKFFGQPLLSHAATLERPETFI
jgi:hypothetical protein